MGIHPKSGNLTGLNRAKPGIHCIILEIGYRNYTYIILYLKLYLGRSRTNGVGFGEIRYLNPSPQTCQGKYIHIVHTPWLAVHRVGKKEGREEEGW